jgi:hypothetical protein
MKKVVWIVMKGDEEMGRVKTRKMAEAIALYIDGWFYKYAVE